MATPYRMFRDGKMWLVTPGPNGSTVSVDTDTSAPTAPLPLRTPAKVIKSPLLKDDGFKYLGDIQKKRSKLIVASGRG